RAYHTPPLLSLPLPSSAPLSASPPFLYHPTAPPDIYTLSLHDALPISSPQMRGPVLMWRRGACAAIAGAATMWPVGPIRATRHTDRKSTRLNSSHVSISYAVFCLKKKKRVILVELVECAGGSDGGNAGM